MGKLGHSRSKGQDRTRKQLFRPVSPKTATAKRTARPGVNAEQLYAGVIGNHELLTGREELALAKRLEQAEVTIWKRLLDGPLAPEARRLLAELDPPVSGRCSATRARASDLDRQVIFRIPAEMFDPELRGLLAEAERIRARFVACNLRLVPSTIRRHNYHLTTNLSMSDLIQEGNLGLLKAIPRFDYRRGLRFSTFATWWIRHYLVRARQNLGDEVRVPVHMHDLASKVRRAQVQLRSEMGRDPSQDEIAATLQVSPKSLLTLEGAWLKHRESLPPFDSIGEEGEAPSYLASEAEPADAVLDRHQDERRIAAAIARMPPLLAKIVCRRFGLDGADSETFKEIGVTMNLSRERIRQLEGKALGILRRVLGDEDAADAAA
jgi:RNA polymerase primary sigma factor